MRIFLAILWLGVTALLVRVVADSWRLDWTPFFVLCLAAALLLEGWLVFSVLFYRRFRQPVQNAWLVLLSSAVALLIPDLLLNRLRDVHRYASIYPDPVVHHRLRPNTRSLMRSNEFRAEIRTNSLGLRGPEPGAAMASGDIGGGGAHAGGAPERHEHHRVLLLGDSFTQGEGVSREETFAARLEGLLAAALPAPVEVINGGVDSYTPILSYLLYKNDLRRLQADVVVLNLDMSDLLQEQYYRSRARFGDGGEPLAVPNRRLQGNLAVAIEDWISRNLYVLRYLFLQLRDAVNGGAPETMEAVIARQTGGLLQHTLAGDAVDRDAQWRDLFDSIVRLERLCRQDGTRFLLALYPWGHQVAEREWVPGRFYWMPQAAVASEASLQAVRRLCQEHGIPLIDAVPAFRAHAGDDFLYFRHDMHFTPAGHRVMARALLEPVLAELRESPEETR